MRRELRPTLRALEGAAADLAGADRPAVDLPALQYALHVARERVLGLEPLPELEDAHDELGAALAIAREETADVAEALTEAGPAAAAPLVWEWRAALFGIRLALRRIERADAPAAVAERPAQTVAPVVVLALGVLVVLTGALVEVWPLWAIGLLLVAAATAVSRGRP